MVTIDLIFSDRIEIKQSKFMGYLIPIALYEEEMKRLREKHSKAVHFVSAYRMLNEFDQIVEYSGDDGEPKGTSGKPTLSVLQGHELINAAIITVRYFGGTKLGPGGLVRAYAEAANAACSAAMFIPYEKLLIQKITCDYSHVSMVEYEITCEHIRIVTKEFGERGAMFEIVATKENLERFYSTLGRTIHIV
ncbi:MAG: YigZ family protein [Sulfuricurvum sp.]|nr:YigZ family protein [Sulfuricurvum sp.]